MLLIMKLLAQLAYPLSLCLILVPLGLLARYAGWRRSGGLLIAFGLVWLLVWSLAVPSRWLRESLEQVYPARPAAEYPVADAIVVLGGGIEGYRSGSRAGPNLQSGADREWFAAKLWHAGRAPVVILSGGAVQWSTSDQPGADAMAEFMQALGVPDSALIRESRSRTTHENAAFTSQILRERGIHRILLVTSALHMPRSMATFATLGVEVIPAPTDVEAVAPLRSSPLDWIPDTGALDGSTRAIKEYLGLWMYRLRGWAG